MPEDKKQQESLPDNLIKRVKIMKMTQSEKKDPDLSYSAMGAGMRISIDFVAAIFVGVILGYWLDRYFGTEPLFLLILFFLGAITGFYSVYRTAKRLDSLAEREAQDRDR